MNINELSNYFNASLSTLQTNFPKFCQQQLKKGFKVTKTGKGPSAEYTVERVTPQYVDKKVFSSRTNEDGTIPIAPDEVWTTTYCSSKHEVSNYGRFRRKNGTLLTGYIGEDGYQAISINDKTYRAHRIVLQSFLPMNNFELLTVDHINGIRSDNRLSNLRWSSMEDNISAMMANRLTLNTELTRLIQIHGYEETLELLKSLS